MKELTRQEVEDLIVKGEALLDASKEKLQDQPTEPSSSEIKANG